MYTNKKHHISQYKRGKVIWYSLQHCCDCSWTAAVEQPADWDPTERHYFWTL